MSIEYQILHPKSLSNQIRFGKVKSVKQALEETYQCHWTYNRRAGAWYCKENPDWVVRRVGCIDHDGDLKGPTRLILYTKDKAIDVHFKESEKIDPDQ